jgi:hypothetical protein
MTKSRALLRAIRIDESVRCAAETEAYAIINKNETEMKSGAPVDAAFLQALAA